jgi:branched-chain amino acid aminotransferase
MPEISETIFIEGMKKLVEIDKAWIPTDEGCSLYIRPIMFATDEIIGVHPSEKYQFFIFTCPVGAYYNKPLRVKIEEKYSRACDGGIGEAKTAGNYAASLYPAKLAKEQGFDQVLWTDSHEHKYFEESGTMNLMFVIDNVLVTPTTSGSILKGITRKSVLQLAKDWNYKIEERRVAVQEIIEAYQKGTLQEAFGVGTAATISHIVEIGYQNQVLKLSSVENRIFSNRVLKALDDIKHGRIADHHNWLYKI